MTLFWYIFVEYEHHLLILLTITKNEHIAKEGCVSVKQN